MRLAIDDFGTGYSCLAYLKRFPIDTLKIDRSFVRDMLDDPNDARDHARHHRAWRTQPEADVVAEGVETAQEVDFLRGADCDEFQGFFFARPMPAHELPAWLAAKDVDRKVLVQLAG